MKIILSSSIVGVALGVGALLSMNSTPSTPEPDLAAVRAATEKYKDVNIALKEGYIRDPGNMCDAAGMMGQPDSLGVMGIHFFRPDLLGITGTSPKVDGNGRHLDFTKPSILIYEPQQNGSLALVAVENLVFIKAWEEAGNTKAPSFQGVPFDRMEDNPATAVDEAHNFAPHYDRHVWIYRDNPRGVFAQYNPNATCKYHKQEAHKHS